MASSHASRLGASVLLSLVLTAGLSTVALGASPADPSPGPTIATKAAATPSSTTVSTVSTVLSSTADYHIDGTVTGTGGTPLDGIEVYAYSSDYESYWTDTAPNGTYSIPVPAGTYTVYFAPSGRYLAGWYSSSGFVLNSASSATTDVSVSTSDVGGIDVQMPTGYFITGTVTGPGGEPLDGIEVEANSSLYGGDDTFTTSDGTYSKLVAPGATYIVGFLDPDGILFFGYYCGTTVPCTYGSVPGPMGVTVSTSDVGGISVQMETWEVTLEASATNVTAGTSVWLTAQTNRDVGPSSYYLVILSSDHSVVASFGSGTTWLVKVTKSVAASETYTAVVGTSTGGSPRAISTAVTVTWIGPAATLAVSGLPSPTVAGVAHNVTVTAKDAYGNTATGYRGKVHFTSSDPAAVLPADYTFTATDAGVHVFSVTLKTAGTRSVTATDTVTASITGSQSAIVVNPGSATALTVSGLASPRTAGVAGSLTLTARDPYANLATTYRGKVHFTSTDPLALLPPDYTFTAADSGVHTFSVTLKTVGTQSVTATDTVTASITGSQAAIVVTYPAATYTPISPRRILDSRPTGSGHTNIGLAGKFSAGTVRKFSVAGAKYVGGGSAAAIPANAVAVTGNLTVVGETAAGVIDLGPTVSAAGTTTTLSFVKGDIRANNVTLGLAFDGSLEAVYRSSTVGATTDLIFDVTGFFTPGTSGATYHSLAPGRVLDTRPSGGGVTHIGPLTKLPNRTVRTFPVAGVKALGWSSALVPSNAVAITGNLTVTGATSAGYVSLGPTMTSSPSTSTLNVAAGSTVANGVSVALSAGKLQVVWCGTTGSSANVIFDVTGYFTAGCRWSVLLRHRTGQRPRLVQEPGPFRYLREPDRSTLHHRRCRCRPSRRCRHQRQPDPAQPHICGLGPGIT